MNRTPKLSRGIADALTAAAAGRLEERDIGRVELQVFVEDSDAREFYRRRGWGEEIVQTVRELDDK